MDQCDMCGKNPASMQFTQIVNDETTVHNLCEECAKKQGISVSVSIGSATTAQTSTAQPSVPDPDALRACPRCGVTAAEIKAKGWIGCALCADTFGVELNAVLKEIHGQSTHAGKKFAGVESQSAVFVNAADITVLRAQLALAIQNEKFEDAASIRDTIHTMNSAGGSHL